MVGLGSCINENSLSESKQQANSNNYTIPINDAIKQLNVFLQSNSQKTRGASITYSEVEVVCSKAITRSDSESTPTVDSLLYLINFDNNMGYAVLAADRRLETSILAVTEMGSISSDDFNRSSYNDTRVEDGGFDSGLGDYGDGNNGDGTGLPNDLIVDFVKGKMGDGYNYGGIITPPSTPPTYFVKPLLTTIWGQLWPYNVKCPIEDEVHTHTGCVATAIGQVVAHFGEEKSDKNYKWAQILEVGKMEDSGGLQYSNAPYSNNIVSYTDEQVNEVASLLKEIGDICDMNYGSNGSTTMPWKIDNCLKDFGFENSDFYWGYDVDDITNSLLRDYPVIISAASGTNGHTWVIDGYDIQQDPDNENNTILLHCNWGWDGISNGFYYSGIFDLNAGAEIYDQNYGDIAGIADSNYSWMFSTVLPDVR